jgi:hypothetical protein
MPTDHPRVEHDVIWLQLCQDLLKELAREGRAHGRSVPGGMTSAGQAAAPGICRDRVPGATAREFTVSGWTSAELRERRGYGPSRWPTAPKGRRESPAGGAAGPQQCAAVQLPSTRRHRRARDDAGASPSGLRTAARARSRSSPRCSSTPDRQPTRSPRPTAPRAPRRAPTIAIRLTSVAAVAIELGDRGGSLAGEPLAMVGRGLVGGEQRGEGSSSAIAVASFVAGREVVDERDPGAFGRAVLESELPRRAAPRRPSSRRPGPSARATVAGAFQPRCRGSPTSLASTRSRSRSVGRRRRPGAGRRAGRRPAGRCRAVAASCWPPACACVDVDLSRSPRGPAARRQEGRQGSAESIVEPAT